MRISRGALAVLALAGAGAFFLFRSKKAAAATAELPPTDEEGEIDEEESVIRLPDFVPPPLVPGGVPVGPAPAPAPPPSRPIGPPPPPAVIPPLEDLEEELEPVIPPFVPPPISNIPTPAPAPALPIPIPLPPPQLEPGIPDLVVLPPQQGGGIVIPPALPRLPIPTAPEPAQPDVPADTAELASLMLEKEATNKWKSAEPLLKSWLVSRGQPASDKFGPGSAALMAEELGTLPIIRFWPSATGRNPKKAIDEYRATLAEIAARKPEPHRSQLLASAEREQGQSFGPPQGDGGKTPIADRVTLDILGEEA